MEADGAPSIPPCFCQCSVLRVFKAMATRNRGKSKQTLKSLKIEPETYRSGNPRTNQMSHDCSSAILLISLFVEPQILYMCAVKMCVIRL